jgi:hypothetical protein
VALQHRQHVRSRSWSIGHTANISKSRRDRETPIGASSALLPSAAFSVCSCHAQGALHHPKPRQAASGPRRVPYGGMTCGRTEKSGGRRMDILSIPRLAFMRLAFNKSRPYVVLYERYANVPWSRARPAG